MACSPELIEYLCGQIPPEYAVRAKKMFGEYMIYVDEKPLLLVCDNTVFVKELPCVSALLCDAPRGLPYPGAKEHYILDIDDGALLAQVLSLLAQALPLPKKKKRT